MLRLLGPTLPNSGDLERLGGGAREGSGIGGPGLVFLWGLEISRSERHWLDGIRKKKKQYNAINSRIFLPLTTAPCSAWRDRRQDADSRN